MWYTYWGQVNDNWEIKVGDSIVQKINEGLDSSSYLIVALSNASIKSFWVIEELSAAIALLKNKVSFILPLLLDDCNLPPLLAHYQYVNYGKNPEKAIEEIIETIRRMAVSDERLDQTHISQTISSAMIAEYARQIDEVSTNNEKNKIKEELINKIAYITKGEEMPPEVFIIYVDRMLANKTWLTIPEFIITLENPEVINSWSDTVEQKVVEWLLKVMQMNAPESGSSQTE